ncbi:hypothetical protein Nepgr_009402 [Nepenthes gracilis]|uniref:Uncharacterized protein n=1 Tax=Nepenthes gracilis TaxID=150966 RepID=A0AAD3SBB3_NEPGR|nr:hypothetical protein Nepgr_009402 [Nepenthes gracilis]
MSGMEENSYSDHKSPLLSSPERRLNANARRARLGRWNSVDILKNDFVSRLPEKVRSGLNAECPYDIDLTRTSGLTEAAKSLKEANDFQEHAKPTAFKFQVYACRQVKIEFTNPEAQPHEDNESGEKFTIVNELADLVSANPEETEFFDKVEIFVLLCEDNLQSNKISWSKREEEKATEEKCQIIEFGIMNCHSNNHPRVGHP